MHIALNLNRRDVFAMYNEMNDSTIRSNLRGIAKSGVLKVSYR